MHEVFVLVIVYFSRLGVFLSQMVRTYSLIIPENEDLPAVTLAAAGSESHHLSAGVVSAGIQSL